MFLFSLTFLFTSMVFGYPADFPADLKSFREFVDEPPPMQISDAPDFLYEGDAPYYATTDQLSSILNCPNGQPNSSSNTVLLVHGTGSTGYESWGHGYVPALASVGYTPCYLTLPNRSSGDLQYTSSYVAYNIHLVSQLSGQNQISIIGHSQGGPDIQWALRFFPSTRPLIKQFIGLSPDLGPGTLYFRTLCNTFGDNICDAAAWQQSTDSNFFRALNYKGKQSFAPTTLIWTSSDEIVLPPEENAQLAGATTISVEDVCPNQTPDHFAMLINPTAYAIALDALEYGEVDVKRIPQSACVGEQAPGMDINTKEIAQAVFGDLIQGSLLAQPKLSGEPPLLPYAKISNQ